MASTERLPVWAETLRQRFLAGESSMFLLHGNVKDICRFDGADGVEYVPTRTFLERFLARSKSVVAYYNCSEGVTFPEPQMRREFINTVNAVRVMSGLGELGVIPTASYEVLPQLESLVMNGAVSSAVILDYFETIVPQANLSFMGEGDKGNLVTLQRWTSSPSLLSSNNVVVLMTENISDANRRITSSPQLAHISVALPTLNERLDFINFEVERSNGKVTLDVTVEQLAKHAAGLSLTSIRALFRNAEQSQSPITFKAIAARKKIIIEQECHGLVEFVEPRHNFSHVGGMERVKSDLMRIAGAIKQGHTSRVPMGVIFVGPMGTGKTYVAEAFAGESGLTCIKFKNFRDKWVGSTEANLEKILSVVDALGYVLLIIDEADRSLSSGSGGDSGTNSRVIARLKEFMSDTTHRGRVVILLMTNRPDKLDTDLKRPGRFDLKIPFFFPETIVERRAIFEAQVRKNGLNLSDGVTVEEAADNTAGYSAAELEAVILAASANSGVDGRDSITSEDIARAVEDVIPSRDTRMLEFMEMLAVFEASSRRLLPDRFREMGADEVQLKLDQLRLVLGGRVR